MKLAVIWATTVLEQRGPEVNHPRGEKPGQAEGGPEALQVAQRVGRPRRRAVADEHRGWVLSCAG
jgi:hypothetical protein